MDGKAHQSAVKANNKKTPQVYDLLKGEKESPRGLKKDFKDS